jgi:hypothetical protein
VFSRKLSIHCATHRLIVIGLMDAEYIFSGFWKFTPCQIFKSRLSFHHGNGMHKKVNRYYIDHSSCTCNYWGLEVSNDDWSLNVAQWMVNFLENTSFHYFSEVHVTCFQFSMFYAVLCLSLSNFLWKKNLNIPKR